MDAITIHSMTSDDYSGSGLGLLKPLDMTVRWVLNGMYQLDATVALNEPMAAALQLGAVIVAPVPAQETPSLRIGGTAGSTQSREIWRVKTNGSNLHLRSGPGTKYKILSKYRNGTELVLLEKTNGSWYRMAAPDGASGYMAVQWLKYLRTETETIPGSEADEVIAPKPVRRQPFRIHRIEPGLLTVTVHARQLFYDLSDNLVLPHTYENVTRQGALSAILSRCLNADHGFTARCEGAQTATLELTEPVSPVEALLGDGGLIDRLGGEVMADWLDVYVVDRLGSDRGVEVRYGKNLTAVGGALDADDMATRIVPIGESDKGEDLYLPEVYLEAAGAQPWAHPRYGVLRVEGAQVSKSMTAAQTYEKMRTAARELLDSGAAKANASITVEFVEDSKLMSASDMAKLQKLFPGDDVAVSIAPMGITAKLRLVEYVFDCLLLRYRSATLGSAGRDIATSGIDPRQLPSAGISGAKLANASVQAKQLADGSVKSAKIGAAAIEIAHIQQATIDTLKSNSLEAVKADIKEIVAGKIDADALTAGAVTAEKLAAGAVEAEKLAAEAVTAGKLAAGAVTADKLAAGAVKAEKIKAGAVDTAKLAAGAVTAEKIASGTITADRLKAKTITAESGIIDDSAIGTAQIADGSITSAKIVELNADLIKAGTLSAERLLLVGEDGVIYKINAASSGLSLTELQKDQYKNYINGTVIVAKSITAAQIAAQSITGNEILAGSVTAKEIDVSDLFADEATVNALNAMDIRGNKYLQLYVTDKVDGIAVGGRNLLRGTNQGAANWNWSMQTGGKTVEEYLDGGVRAVKMTRDAAEQTGWSVITYAVSEDTYALLEPNTEYTLSFDYKPSVATANGVAFSIRRGDGSNAATNDGGYWKEIPANEWTHVSGTFTTAANLPDFLLYSTEIYITRLPTTANSVHIFKNLKLEKGNKSTDWSPAPEDIEGDVSALERRMSTAEQKITADAIVSTVTSSTSYKALSSTAEAAKKSIDGLNIGGRNYIVKSEGPLSVTNDGSGKVTSMLLNAASKEKAVSLFGQTVTVSFDWSHTVTEGTATLLFNSKYNGVFAFNSSKPSTGHYKNTFVLAALDPVPAWANENVIYLDGTYTGAVTLTNVKVEVGNRATDWSPAPEDIEARVTTAESKIDQKADSITLSVLETKVDGISVGGRNLLRGTNQGAVNWSWSMQTGGKTVEEYLDGGVRAVKMTRDAVEQAGWSVITYAVSEDTYTHLEPNTEYTLSFDYKPSVATANGIMFSIKKFNGADAASGDGGYWKEIPANEWTHVSGQFTTVEEIPAYEPNSYCVYITRMPSAVNSVHIFKNLKLEKGNKATDWSPAPEDPAGSLSVNSDYSKVDINTERVRIVSKRMEVAVPSDDGEDDVLRVDADGVHAEVVEADVIVSESVVRTQGAASYTPANAGELAAILEELSGKHLTGSVSINCKNVSSGSFSIDRISGGGYVSLNNGTMNALEITNCGASVVVYLSRIAFSTSGTALTISNAHEVYVDSCTFNAGVGVHLGSGWPSQAYMASCAGDCATMAQVALMSRLCICGASKPTGTVSLTYGGEVYNATSDPSFTAKADPSLPTTQTVTASLSPTQTYTLRGTSNSDGNKLYQGRYSSSQPLRRGVMLFSLPSDLTSADKIDSATLTIRRIGGVGQGGGVTVQVRCYDVTGTLYASKTAYDGQTVSIDVTAAVKAMKTNGYTGLMLYNPDTTTAGSKSYTASYARFAGKGESGAPVLKVSYRK